MKSYIEAIEEKKHRIEEVLLFIDSRAPSSKYCSTYINGYIVCNKLFHSVAVQYKKEIETYLKENKLNRYVKVNLKPNTVLVDIELQLEQHVTERQFNNLYALCKLLGMS